VDCYGDFDSSPVAAMNGGYVIDATPLALVLAEFF